MSSLKLTNQNSSQQSEVDSNIRICYFTVNTNKGTGYICVALKRPEKGSSSTTYRASFASYNPQDEKTFSKVQARNAAVGRILNWRSERKDDKGDICETNPRIEFDYINYPNIENFNVNGKFNLKDVFVRALNLAMYSRNVPNWVYRSNFIAYGLDPVMSYAAHNPLVLNREVRDDLRKVIGAH